ncbi:hypothetical protein [Eubacterium sp.]|uniref:hypothetical protein n=1 Tax=Eubacterium sp. TaxID=142586 RepID=UPI003F0B7858
MKQSERIQYCKKYGKNCYSNPLWKEYKKEKKDIYKKLQPLWVRWPRIMVIGYLFLFIVSWVSVMALPEGIENVALVTFWASLILGVINLVVFFFGLGYVPEDDFADELEKLCEKYAKKGFFEEDELFLHECCEYDICQDSFVCCVTKQPLSSQDYYFCSRPGNCKQCRTFVSAYLGADAVEWWGESHEYKR